MPGAAASIRMDGGRRLERLLKTLPERLQIKVLSSAVRKAARPIIKAARKKIKHDETGLLKESLGTVVRKNRRTGSVLAVIGPRRGVGTRRRERLSGSRKKREPANYAHLVEGGTEKHGQRGFAFLGGFIRFGGDQHPGTPPRPFLQPAFDENDRRALAIMRRTLSRGIGREARRLR